VVPFHDDELLASWLLRLSQENCFSELTTFLNAYVYPNQELSAYAKIRKDLSIPFELLWRALPHDVMDERTLFFKTSIFTGVMPFMPKERRQRYVNRAFRTSQHLESLYQAPRNVAKGSIICPECVSDELKQYGHFYLHRAHHMPGVSVCHIHGCPLGRVPAQYRNLRNDCLPNYNLLEQPATDRNLEYAVFAKDFLDAEFDCDIDDVLDIVERKKIANVAADMNTTGYAALTGRDVEAYFRLRHREYASPQAYLAALLYIYKNTDNLQKDLTKNQNKTQTFDGYSLNAVYRNDLLSMRHECCGQTFCTSPYGFEIGWRCPTCDTKTTLQEKYRDLIHAIGNGEYEPITPFHGMDDNVTLFHKICGRGITRRARSFIFGGVRCDCSRRVDFQRAKKNVEQYDGFSLLEYERTDRPITVKHSCGGTFSIYYSKFMGDPRCRVCRRKGHLQIRTTEDFRSDVFDLTGDEYSLVGEYNGPHNYLTIWHNVCGTKQEYRPYYFLDGGRCRCCHVEMTEEEFKDYVSKVSMGRYVIEGKATKNLYEVKDTFSGGSIRLNKLKILQELQRPTPSPILQVEARDDSIDLQRVQVCGEWKRKPWQQKGKMKTVMDYLTRNSFYVSGEPIFLDDLEINGLTYEEVQQTMSKLSKRRKLVHLITGAYGFPGQEYPANVIITSKYLVRQGRHIGFLRGACFASRLGLETKGSPEWSVATNRESPKTTNRKLSPLGVPVHIKGASTKITDNNYLVLSIIDFLLQYRQCTKSPFETVLEALQHYVRENNHGVMLPYSAFEPHIEAYKTANIRVMMRQRITALCEEGVPNGKSDL